MARGVDRVAHTHVVAEVPVVVREVDERADYVQADDVGEAIEASELKLCGLDYTEDSSPCVTSATCAIPPTSVATFSARSASASTHRIRAPRDASALAV